jgi:hopanoid-associated phosphorylase
VRLVCVSGLASEARIAKRAGLDAVVAAGGPDRVQSLVAAAATRADLLVSFGIAGALSPHLQPGALIVACDVVAEDGCWRGEAGWRRRAVGFAHTIGAVQASVFGAARILAAAEAKRQVWEKTGAAVVDLESAVVAAAAEEARIPFLVLRAVADPAWRTLPPAALLPLGDRGAPDLRRIAAAVLRRPEQLPSLIALAREARQGLAALVRPAGALARTFASV